MSVIKKPIKNYVLNWKVIFVRILGVIMSKKNNFFRLEMLYLKILDEKDCYGYEITHTLKERTNGKINVKEGTMYPILYKFEEIGYITSEKNWLVKE